MMKIIMLDIDGVLNSGDWYHRRPKTPRKSFLDTELDPDAVKRLVHIIIETNANIVVSSSWRILHTLDEICTYLGEATMTKDWWDSKIIGLTPRIYTKTDGVIEIAAIRGDEIKAWLKSTNHDIEKYVIIDDDSDMLEEQKPFFVQTNFEYGLTAEKTKEVLEKLK